MSKLPIKQVRSWINRLHHRLHIDISSTEITVLHSTAVLRHRLQVLQHDCVHEAQWHNEEALLQHLHQMLSGLRCHKMKVSITVADSLGRLWMVTPPQNATRLADCQAAAEQRFCTLFGEAARHWEISADWDAYRPFLASAMPRSLLERLKALCAHYQLNVLQLQPQFVSVWNRFCKQLQPNAWIALLEQHTLTIGAVTQGRLVALRSITVVPELLQQRSWIDQHIQREVMLLNLSMPQQLHISGRMPAQWQKQVDDQIHCLPLGERLEGDWS